MAGVLQLHIRGNSFVDENNHKVMLRGFAIADPFRLREVDHYDILQEIPVIKKLGANVIRIPIMSGLWNSVPDLLEAYIDPVVNACKKNDIYCVLDWHAVGNPLKDQTRLADSKYIVDGKDFFIHDASFSLALSAWEIISQRYSNEPRVLFEVFNEPAPGEEDLPKLGLSALPWREWKEALLKVIRVVRTYSGNIILASPTQWAYDLARVLEDPIREFDDIAYSVHPYPIHRGWKPNFDAAHDKLPLLVTEWGFKEDTDEVFMKGTREDYGLPLQDYMESHQIGWIAWCYDPVWSPRILKKPWTARKYTPWGSFVVEQLKNATS